MILTHWEWLELREHLESRPDIWVETPRGWMRMDTEENPCVGLLIRPPDHSDPIRMYEVQAIGFQWTQEDADTYLHRLCMKFTPYGQRLLYAQTLREELSLAPEKAMAVACLLLRLDTDEVPAPETPPTQLSLFEDSPKECEFSTTEPREVTFPLRGLGYVRLRLGGGMLRVQLSLPTHRDHGGGFASIPLEGYVRPRTGNARDTFGLLAGWKMGDAEEENEDQEGTAADRS